jgi:hypothetical protein
MKNLYLEKILLGSLLMVFAFTANAQINNPVLWSYSAKKISDKTYEIHLTATIGDKWHMYSQEDKDAPAPTTISFTANPLVSLDGKVKEVGKMERAFDKNFNMVLKYYGNKVVFVQKVKVKSAVATVVKGTINYTVCNDRQCLPPRDVPFSINIGGK